jgi:molybdopterin-guanine dinucleotide biosynthesis protein A
MYNRRMVTVAIQAGGESSRMGRDKALLPLAGKPLIEHVLSKVADLGDELIITSNRPESLAYLGVKIASDRAPDGGTLQGLRTALAAATHPRVLVVACDMPFLNRPLLEYLLDRSREGVDVVVPKHGRYYEPLHAVYRRRVVLPEINASLAAGILRLNNLLPRVNVLAIGNEELDCFDPQRLSFFNINTPQDLQRAKELLGE